jgi:tetratricopeptide (TPR) repeat protein
MFAYNHSEEALALATKAVGILKQAMAILVERDSSELNLAAINQVRAITGVIEAKSGQFDAALQNLASVESGVWRPPALRNIGVIQGFMGDADREISSYREALALDPTYTQAYLCLGNSLSLQGQAAKALKVSGLQV